MDAYAHTTTRVCRVLLGLAVLWGITWLSGLESWAFDSETTRATLRGVRELEVLVESLEPDVEQAGFTRRQLQTDVELRLRQAGIPVLTREEAYAVPGLPYLYVNVNILLHSDVLVTSNIVVALRQGAFLASDGSLAIVSTWSVGRVGTVGHTRFVNTIRDSVRDKVDEFINAYLSVHPRPTGSATPSPTSLRRDLVRQVQERLVEAGFSPGMPDGKLGPQTQEALRQFQRASNLPVTGTPDQATLKALRVGTEDSSPFSIPREHSNRQRATAPQGSPPSPTGTLLDFTAFDQATSVQQGSPPSPTVTPPSAVHRDTPRRNPFAVSSLSPGATVPPMERPKMPRALLRVGHCENDHWIEFVSDDGEIIKLEDGSVWQVDPEDTVDAATWVPLADVVVCEDKLINLNDNEKVGVIRLR